MSLFSVKKAKYVFFASIVRRLVSKWFGSDENDHSLTVGT